VKGGGTKIAEVRKTTGEPSKNSGRIVRKTKRGHTIESQLLDEGKQKEACLKEREIPFGESTLRKLNNRMG